MNNRCVPVCVCMCVYGLHIYQMCHATMALDFGQDLYLEMCAFFTQLESALMLVCNDSQVIL